MLLDSSQLRSEYLRVTGWTDRRVYRVILSSRFDGDLPLWVEDAIGLPDLSSYLFLCKCRPPPLRPLPRCYVPPSTKTRPTSPSA